MWGQRQYQSTLQRTVTFPINLISKHISEGERLVYRPIFASEKLIFRMWWGSKGWPDPIQGWRTDTIFVIRSWRALCSATATYELLHNNPENVLQDSPWPNRDLRERPRAVAHVAPQYNWAPTHPHPQVAPQYNWAPTHPHPQVAPQYNWAPTHPPTHTLSGAPPRIQTWQQTFP